MSIGKLSALKTNIIDTLVNSDDVATLLLPSKDTGYSIKEQLLGHELNGEKVFEPLIHPYCFIPETVDTKRTYIGVETTQPSSIYDGNFVNYTLTVYIFTHTTLINLVPKIRAFLGKRGYHGSALHDVLAQIVDAEIMKKDDYGLGKLKRQSIGIFNPNPQFYGRVLNYTIKAKEDDNLCFPAG